MAGIAVEPTATAVGAGAQAAVAGEFLAHRRRFGVVPATLDVAKHALERMPPFGAAAASRGVGEGDEFIAAAVEQHLSHPFRQFLPRLLNVETVVGGQRADDLQVMWVVAVPAAHRAARERQMREGDEPRRVEERLLTQTVAGRAGAGGAVEGEHLRFECRHGVAADRTGVAIGEQQSRTARSLFLERHHPRRAAREPQRGLEGLGEALRGVGAQPQAVDHRIDAVLAPGIEFRRGIELVHLTVDAGAHEALRLQVAQGRLVAALAILHQGRKQQHGGTLGHL